MDSDSTKNVKLALQSKVSREDAEKAVETLIKWAGDDPEREGLKETPKRVINAYEEFFSGYKESAEKYLSKTFEDVQGYKDMVLLKDIPFNSHCEHHMVPVIGVAHIAYIPVKRVVGISKLARIVEIYARRLQNQERITTQIADDLEKYLEPMGAAVIIDAKHQCMGCRGVKKSNATMTTSAMRGVFFDRAEARSELMDLIKN